MVRVVIADDHAGIREFVGRLLSKKLENVAVVGEAENGARALELVGQEQPDVLILDIEMPVLTGVDVARRLRAERAGPRIIVLSNTADREMVNSLLELGVDGYVLKEDAPEHLPAAVQYVQAGQEGWLSPSVQELVA